MLGSGLLESGVGAAAAWLALWLTYSLHAAIWYGAAALIARLHSLSPSTQHGLWKMALFAPLATTALALLLRSGLGHAFGTAAYLTEGATWYLAGAQLSDTTPLAQASQLGATASSPPLTSAASPLGAAFGWDLLAAGSLVASLLGLLRFALSLRSLWRRLRERTSVQDARLLQRLSLLRAQVGLPPIAFTESSRITSPLVIGASEICIPAALLASLDDAEVDSVLAHELAHLERGDGLWFPCAGLLQCMLWLQPLNHLVAARFRDSAELACDDRAVELTAQTLPLARALTRLAAGALSAQHRLALPSMAGSASTLVLRVKRLANATAPSPADSRGRRPALLLLGVIGLAAAGLAVGRRGCI